MGDVSEHAKKRVHQRVGVTKSSADRLIKLVRERGVPYQEINGALRRYMDKQRWRYKDNAMYLYGGAIYVFQDDICATVLKVPPAMKKRADMIQRKRNGDGDEPKKG